VPRLSGLARLPPIVEEADVRLLDPPREQAELRVRYRTDAALAPTVPLSLEHETIVLRDDGEPPDQTARDYLYTARFELDTDALRERHAKLEKLAEELGRPLTYVQNTGRTIVGRIPMTSFPITELLSGAAVALAQEGVSVDEIDASRSLFITATSVVTDPTRTSDGCPENDPVPNPSPGGLWTFGYLMSQLHGSDASKRASDWLHLWETKQSINGFDVAARPNVRILIDRWQKSSGGPNQPLDMSKAPFRLLAIVLRIDLAGNSIYGSTKGGELRFVFGAVGNACHPMSATVIFEYGVHAGTCLVMKEWAQKWVDLAQLTLGSPDYNKSLAELTQAIVAPPPGSPLKGGLKQIRTNEEAFLNHVDLLPTPFWELREFKLDPTSGALLQVTVKQTPDLSRNGSQVLANYVNANASAIRAHSNIVPDKYPCTSSFLGGSALMAPTSASNRGTYWQGPTPGSISDPEARFEFSLDTCNGCHAGETMTGGFHVNPRQPATVPATLSKFLTGTGGPVPDPTGVMIGGAALEHSFGDLDLRRQDLARFANQSCVFWLLRDPRIAPPIFTH
jgi:hypothetical protein